MKLTHNLYFAGASLAVASAALAATPASAFTVTDSSTGQQYNIGTTTESFLNQSLLLASQPWWGNSALASDFAQQLGTALGTPNAPSTGASGEGPYFAFGLNLFTTPASVEVANWDMNIGTTEIDSKNNPLDDRALVYAYVAPATAAAAAAVPTPALLPAMLGMGASIIRKRKKQAEASG